MNKAIAFLAAFCIALHGYSQNTRYLNLNDVYATVAVNHPIVMQANLVQEAANWDIRMARGNFDPAFYTDYSNKIFSGDDSKAKLYWDQIYSGLKVPTWFGADFNFNYQNATGTYLDNELTVPQGGLYTAGISIPVGRGLFIDNRRATLRQAQLYTTIAGAEKQKLINKTLFIITKDYWDWYYNYQKLLFTEKTYKLAKERYLLIAENVRNGEDAPIDSVEAHFNFIQREQSYMQSQTDFNNAGLGLSTHLWKDGIVPLELDTNIFPTDEGTQVDSLLEIKVTQLIDSATTTHPEIVKLDFKLKQLDIDKRLSVENFKPIINVNYNFLSSNNFNTGFGPIFRNNYKSGVEIYMPLFLRKERGKYNLIKNKINQTSFEREFTIRENKNNLLVAYNDFLMFKKLVQSQVLVVKNLQELYDAEQLKFTNGESTLFLINTRETNLINGQIKLAELKAKYAVAKANIKFAAGLAKW